MNPILKNILAVIAGWVLGSIINIGIVMLSPIIYPLPEGVNPMDPVSVKANIAAYDTIHFIFPLLAHALGALVGGFIAAKVAATHKLAMAMIVGLVFLAGGIYTFMSLGGPMWFHTVDILLAYIPMAYLGYILATR